MNQIAVGVITVSDRAFQGVYEDLGGPALREAATRYGWRILAEAIVPDDIDRIRETIRSFSAQGCALILTTGGTGAAPGRHARSDPFHDARRTAWLRRGDARRLAETDSERHFIAL